MVKQFKEYPDDIPYPSKLILGYISNKPIHLVIAENKLENEIILITVYEPDPLKWNSTYERKI